jgi:hypothetical protein
VHFDQGIQSFVALQPVIENPAVLTYTVTSQDHGIQTGQLYTFKLLAINDVGPSEFSEELSGVMPAELPTPPINPSLISSTSSTIHFQWYESVTSGGTPVQDYQIYWDSGSQGSEFSLLKDSTLGMTSYFQQSGLTSGHYYQFKILALNHIGLSASSQSIRIVAAAVPKQPVDLLRVNSTLTSVTFTWSENIDNGGAEVRDFKVYWD